MSIPSLGEAARTIRRMAVALGVLLVIAAMPAAANAGVSFQLEKTWSNPSDLYVFLFLEVNADAYQNGISIHGDEQSDYVDTSSILSLHLGSTHLDVTLANFTKVAPFFDFRRWNIDLELSPTSKNGLFYFNDSNSDFRFAFDETSGGGGFNTDATMGFRCGITGYCRFDGQLVPVPEPASLALLGAGCIALAVFRRRRTVYSLT